MFHSRKLLTYDVCAIGFFIEMQSRINAQLFSFKDQANAEGNAK